MTLKLIQYKPKIFRILNQKFTRNFSLSLKSQNERKPSYYHRIENEKLKYLTFGQLLKSSAEKFANRQALVSCAENNRSITFAEALDKSDRLASGLLNLGLEKGDRVGIWSPNYEFWYISMMATARAGFVCVALNPAYTLSELEYRIEKVDIKAIISPEIFRKQKHYEMLSNLIPAMKDAKTGSSNWQNSKNTLSKVIINSDKLLPGAINFNELLKISTENDVKKIEEIQSKISPDDGCNIQFTSGTTGKSKAALLSHFSMINNGYDIGIRHEFDKKPARICVNVPFFHVYGCVAAIANSLCHGATLVLPAPHFSPEDALKAIVKEKCTAIYGTPTMFVDLVAKQKELKLNLPEIPIANTGGSICTPQLVKDVTGILKVKKFRSFYGLTETSAIAFQSLPEDSSQSVEDYVGTVSNNLEVKVIDRDGNLVKFGEPGELCVRGYSVMLGYWNDEVKTKEVLGEDRWLKTGDQFILNENGVGKISGRYKEMIIRGGENLFPREIEDFLNTHEDILETHVIGIPDERMGEEVGAFIRVKDKTKKLTREEIKKFCKGKLSHFKIPRYVIIVDEFPKTTSGKIQKFKFPEMYAKEIEEAKLQK
ncbi:hypothetical protein PVAND_004682 [Polypedilum vanderplanki]|uniref:Medium-chain acyl-CoA ligase ACSF2, mitochondrial n=1 Tax=Polypedilum vanderplanki TaxID=319348 RepID=A0A9J6BYA5_POLVA|nr:hypothetical protein PVAND_004682 [Polypedilum vanderplanki]